MKIEFLSVDDVLELHAMLIERFGGSPGLRDQALLESAIAQPVASFGGEHLHVDLFSMAAAYLFHIVSNHPFVDGNKRTGLLAALVFLDDNGVTLNKGSSELYELTMRVAASGASKSEVAQLLEHLASQE